MKREAEFQTLFRHHIAKNPPDGPEVYELKLCKHYRFPFSAVKDHQIEGLLKAKTGLFHKISDSPFNPGLSFTYKKPFDCLWIKADAFVCVLFYVPRKPKEYVKIDINHFIAIRDNHSKKSITLQELKDLGCQTFVL